MKKDKILCFLLQKNRSKIGKKEPVLRRHFYAKKPANLTTVRFPTFKIPITFNKRKKHVNIFYFKGGIP